MPDSGFGKGLLVSIIQPYVEAAPLARGEADESVRSDACNGSPIGEVTHDASPHHYVRA